MQGQTRLDLEAAQAVVVRAAELQARYEQTMSVAEMENVAAELGVSADFVRQALKERAEQRTPQTLVATTPRPHRALPLSLQRAILAGVSLCMALYVSVLLATDFANGSPFEAAWTVLCMGLVCGTVTRSVERGGKYGAVIGAVSTIVTAILFATRGVLPSALVVLLAFLFVLLATAGGAVGGSLATRLNRLSFFPAERSRPISKTGT